MKKNTKYLLAGGAAALGLYLYSRSRARPIAAAVKTAPAPTGLLSGLTSMLKTAITGFGGVVAPPPKWYYVPTVSDDASLWTTQPPPWKTGEPNRGFACFDARNPSIRIPLDDKRCAPQIWVGTGGFERHRRALGSLGGLHGSLGHSGLGSLGGS